MKLHKVFILRHNIQSKPAMWYGWFSARHQRWIGLTRFPVGSHRRLIKRYLRPVHAVSCSVLMVGYKETVRARAILLTHHQRINQFQSSCVTTVQESRDGRLQTTRDTPEGAQNPGINETELSSPCNRKPHVIDQDFIEFNILSLIIFNYLTENATCFADRQNIYADRRLRNTVLDVCFDFIKIVSFGKHIICHLMRRLFGQRLVLRADRNYSKNVKVLLRIQT